MLRRGARGGYRADAVGEEGDTEGGAWVEVLSDEEVAVVEGGGCEGYDGLGVLGDVFQRSAGAWEDLLRCPWAGALGL